MSGAVAIVTGANGHLGHAIAERLARDGHAIALVVHRQRDRADALVARLGGPDADRVVLVRDLADPAQVRSLLDAPELANRRIGVLVNNHGILRKAALLDVSERDYDEVMATNLRGVYFLTQLVARRMAASGGGSIVNIGSAAVSLPSLDLGAYTLSKAALLMLTRVAAQELGVHNIRVNAVSPGLVPTAMSQAAYEDPSVLQARRSALAVGRFGEPADIASAVAFLAGPEAAFITGQNLVVDGGSHDNFLKSRAAVASPEEVLDAR